MRHKEKSTFANMNMVHSTISFHTFDEAIIPDETSPEHYKQSTSILYDSMIKSKVSLDRPPLSKLLGKNDDKGHKTINGLNEIDEYDENHKTNENYKKSSDSYPKQLLFKSQTNYIEIKPNISKTFETYKSMGKTLSKALTEKNEKFIEDSMQEIKRKLDDNLKDFDKKLNHEISIISFLEDIYPTLENMRCNHKFELFSVFGFILSKYLFSRVTFIKFSLEKQENILSIDDWNIVKINALLAKKVENFTKKQAKYEENMKVFLEELKSYQTKDVKLKNFLKKDIDFIENKERLFKKPFLSIFMGISEYLEKGKKHGASKYCYAFILRMYYFLHIYHLLGFFQMDLENKLETKDFQENLIKMDLDELKNEIIKLFKSIY